MRSVPRGRPIDVLAMGRSSIDLYSNDVGAPFPEITGFGAFVGGTPTNVSVGTRRLGLRSSLLTAVGADPVGDFVLAFLEREGVDTPISPPKPGAVTSAVVLGIQPPDSFPITFYRDNCADIRIDIDDVAKAPIADAAILLVTGTGLAKEPARSATMAAVEIAREHGTYVALDVDLRANQWHDPRAFGLAIRALLPNVDLVIGTEAELRAGALRDASTHVVGAEMTSPNVEGDTARALETILAAGPSAVALKRGEDGARVYTSDGGVHEAAPFRVDVVNVLGAGDAFASGLLYGLVKGWDWKRCVRMGNATGAIVVTRQGCANHMPTEREALAFVEAGGGWMT